MKADFTKGPWNSVDEIIFAHTERDIDICIHRDGRGVIGTPIADFDCYGRSHSEDCANARLAAAAPELYEALEALYHYIDTLPTADWPDHQIVVNAYQALQKARGEG